jgi:hypothetical protein
MISYKHSYSLTYDVESTTTFSGFSDMGWFVLVFKRLFVNYGLLSEVCHPTHAPRAEFLFTEPRFDSYSRFIFG